MKPTIKPAVREMLDKIDVFLSTAPIDEAQQLWDVLTALRGPDDDDPELKSRTTTHIRAAAFPKARDARRNYHFYASFSTEECPKIFGEMDCLNEHFLGHYYYAQRILLGTKEE